MTSVNSNVYTIKLSNLNASGRDHLNSYLHSISNVLYFADDGAQVEVVAETLPSGQTLTAECNIIDTPDIIELNDLGVQECKKLDNATVGTSIAASFANSSGYFKLHIPVRDGNYNMLNLECLYRIAYTGNYNYNSKLNMYMLVQGANKVISGANLVHTGQLMSTNATSFQNSRIEVVDGLNGEKYAYYVNIYIPVGSYGMIAIQNIIGTDNANGIQYNHKTVTISVVSSIPNTATTEFTISDYSKRLSGYILSNTDLNNIMEPGFYTLGSGNTHVPTYAAESRFQWTAMLVCGNGTDCTYQFVIDRANIINIRRMITSSWGDWIVISANNINGPLTYATSLMVSTDSNSATFTLRQGTASYNRYTATLSLCNQHTNLLGIYVIGVSQQTQSITRISSSGVDATITRNTTDPDKVTVTFDTTGIWSRALLTGPVWGIC